MQRGMEPNANQQPQSLQPYSSMMVVVPMMVPLEQVVAVRAIRIGSGSAHRRLVPVGGLPKESPTEGALGPKLGWLCANAAVAKAVKLSVRMAEASRM